MASVDPVPSKDLISTLRRWNHPVAQLAAAEIERLQRELQAAKDECIERFDQARHFAELSAGRYPHWTCKTHGDFDARVAVGCPECVRVIRQQLDDCNHIIELQAKRLNGGKLPERSPLAPEPRADVIDGLREKLRVYGGHIPPCAGRPCDCGFQVLWDELELGETARAAQPPRDGQ